jgi:predicted DNA-binding protein with PD1-like motif
MLRPANHFPPGRAAQQKEAVMHQKVISDADERTYALILDGGDEVMSQLQKFAEEKSITAARFTAIGAFSAVTLGYFDWNRKDYEKIPVREQVEVLTLAGDIAVHEGKPKLHVHVVVGKRDGTAHGGHLLEAYVRPTLEVILIESPEYLKRTMDEESGLPLIDIGA